MSEEMAKKKKEEIEEIEKQETSDQAELERDKCPYCGKLFNTFEYVTMLPPPFFWMECPGCGMVFCPDSIRKRKLQMGVSAKPSNSDIIVS